MFSVVPEAMFSALPLVSLRVPEAVAEPMLSWPPPLLLLMRYSVPLTLLILTLPARSRTPELVY
jgi:hypothetical protein